MLEEVLKEIEKLLESILVFDAKFKEELLVKASNLDNTKLNELKNILSEVSVWQKKVLETKVKEDPNFYNKISSARKKLDQEIIDLYKQKLNSEDQRKTAIILNKINSI